MSPKQAPFGSHKITCRRWPADGRSKSCYCYYHFFWTNGSLFSFLSPSARVAFSSTFGTAVTLGSNRRGDGSQATAFVRIRSLTHLATRYKSRLLS